MKGAGVAPPEFLIQSSSGKKDWKLAFLTIFLEVLTLLIQRAHIWKTLLFTHYWKFCLDLHTAIAYVNEAQCGISAHRLSIYWWHQGSYISPSLSVLYDWSPQAPLVWIFIKISNWGLWPAAAPLCCVVPKLSSFSYPIFLCHTSLPTLPHL